MTIYGYADNQDGHSEMPEPLVQILTVEDGDVHSVSFHPNDVAKICTALIAAATVALSSGNGTTFVPVALTGEAAS
jgi:hypothetical protein